MKKFSKHTMFAMVAVLATSLFSCTKDDGASAPVATDAVAKTNVPFNLSNADSPNLTGRDVKRGTIDLKIKSINLKATKIWTDGAVQAFNYEVHDVFNILSNGATGYSVADDFISLKDVAIGTNKFEASTTANGAEVNAVNQYEGTFLSIADTDGVADAKLLALKLANPFAVYVGEKTAEIYKPDVAANNVIIPMTTNNGRINATFNLAEYLVKMEYTATITVTEYNAIGVLIKTFAPVLIDNADIATFQWNDVTATNGAYAKYKIDIREKNNPIVYYTYTFNDATTKIDKAVSRSCRYVVNKESVLVDLNGADGFKFTTPWDEVNCPTCPNLVP